MIIKLRIILYLTCGFYIGFNLALIIFVNTSSNDTISSTDLSYSNIIGNTRESSPNRNSIITYTPATVEQTIMDNLIEWGWDKASRKVQGCNIWTEEKNDEDSGASNTIMYETLKAFRKELKEYYNVIDTFVPVVGNIREAIIKVSTGNNNAMGTTSTSTTTTTALTQEDICKTLRLHPDGLPGIFSASSQLSYTSTSGYIEPLTTPMRHPDFCFDTSDKTALMDMKYLIHDFEAMCLSLKPTSRMILIDMGASLSYHTETEVKAETPPIVHLLNLYETFGFHFDHIYGFEVTFTEPNRVFNELLPPKYMASYHWINAGVNPTPGHALNPLDSILRKYNTDDFVVIKVDIDTADIEVPLVKQLLEDESLHASGPLVDQLYFEHHVKFKEMAPIWRSAMKGSLKDTFDLFHGLRQKGIPAHFWP